MDQELIAYLDERIRGTDKRFNTVDRRFNAADERFNAADRRFNAADRRFSDIDGRFHQTSQQMETLREGTNGRFKQIDSRFERMEDSIRRTHVALEDLRGQIQTVAEGIVSTQEMLNAFRSEVKRELQELRSEFRQLLETRDDRVRVLESQRA